MSDQSGKHRGSKKYMLVYTELIHAAQHRGIVTYQELADILDLPLQGNHMGSQIGQILGEIVEDEVSNGRPMLSAIVVGVSGKPGSGFSNLAKELGRFEGADEMEFWEQEKAAVYKAWQKDLKGKA